MNLDDLRGWMHGEDCLVVAPGPSAMRVSPAAYEGHWTIGCNRAVTFCRPEFSICLESRLDECWRVFKAAGLLFVFSYRTDKHPRVVHISTNVYEWMPRPPEDTSLDVALTLSMSPFYGAAVGIALGFETVGLIGVDLDGDGGRFSDDRFQEKWEREWARMDLLAKANGARLVNLNPKSLLKAIDKGVTWADMRPKS